MIMLIAMCMFIISRIVITMFVSLRAVAEVLLLAGGQALQDACGTR